ncbi:DinI-like family protein [Citrobacter braakii]|uniref:DinI-like family protein n=1 Tax=Citrobacter braakii TaxID=57706 RepID=UPI00397B7416
MQSLANRCKALCVPFLSHCINLIKPVALHDDFQVKPMMTLPAINTNASKHEKEQISRAVQEMFEEAEFWLVAE